MSLDNYKKTIEEYIANKGKEAPSKETGKGLLAPKSGTKPMSAESSKKQDDVITNVAEFVYMLRQKRKELVMGKSKKDNKNGRK